MELKDEMLSKGFAADPIVYSYLMVGHVKNSNPDGVFTLYEELKEKLGAVEDGVVYGSLMKGYFLKGMEKEAMECYDEAVGENSKIKMSAVAFNYVLDALSKNGKFDEALRLFDRMTAEHNPPQRLTVNLGSFNVIADGYCAQGKFKDAIQVFRKMGEKRCCPDAPSYNNLIEQLCGNGLLAEAEELYGEMGEKGVKPDEFTYVLLMDACFEANRADDAAGYYRKMVDAGLRPNLAVYNKLVHGLVKAGKIDEAKSFFDLMVNKLKMDEESYKFMMKVLSDAGRLDEMLKLADGMLDDDGVEVNEEVQEFIKGELRKEGREDDLAKLMEEKERAKAEAKRLEIEAAEAAKAKAKASISSLLPPRVFRKDADAGNAVDGGSLNEEVQAGKEDNVEEAVLGEEAAKGENPAEVESQSGGTTEQVTA